MQGAPTANTAAPAVGRTGGIGGVPLVQPPPAEVAIAGAELERWVSDALAEAEARGIRGGAVTPFLLAAVAERSGGSTLRANIGLIVHNARVAAQIAVELAAERS